MQEKFPFLSNLHLPSPSQQSASVESAGILLLRNVGFRVVVTRINTSRVAGGSLKNGEVCLIWGGAHVTLLLLCQTRTSQEFPICPSHVRRTRVAPSPGPL